MRAMFKSLSSARVVAGLAAAMGSLYAIGSLAAVPGITGTGSSPSFALSAGEALSNQPDGLMIYSWGYGCSSQSVGCDLPVGPIAGSDHDCSRRRHGHRGPDE